MARDGGLRWLVPLRPYAAWTVEARGR